MLILCRVAKSRKNEVLTPSEGVKKTGIKMAATSKGINSNHLKLTIIVLE
jgi:hypothetical protein